MKRLIRIVLFVFCVIVISSCKANTNFYSGITYEDIAGPSAPDNAEFVREFKGHGDSWAAVNIVYKKKNDNEFIGKWYVKYIGKEASPTGEISYNYSAGDDKGSGAMTFIQPPDAGIYYMGQLPSRISLPNDDSVIDLQLVWDNAKKSELLKLM
ncbi:hypothetical protein [Cohnella cellulosilytica]|uniref:Lipoprotein n=1 Tax=Cohnella cellulosilytica TaxID=986710 RepID=A0ABW2F337_9BACL